MLLFIHDIDECFSKYNNIWQFSLFIIRLYEAMTTGETSSQTPYYRSNASLSNFSRLSKALSMCIIVSFSFDCKMPHWGKRCLIDDDTPTFHGTIITSRCTEVSKMIRYYL